MKIRDILSSIAHRPWSLPTDQWRYYQEWNHALFLHWKVPAEVLQPLVPSGVKVDMVNGNTWVSLVAFTMENTRPRNLPAITAISDFHEINLRAYVTRDGKPGVYFLSMEGHRKISVWIARSLSGLPYQKSTINRSRKQDLISYVSHNGIRNFRLEAHYHILHDTYEKTIMDHWLTERYCLYYENDGRLYRYETHHAEWKISKVKLEKLDLRYEVGALIIADKPPDLVHYSEGVKVLAWKKERLM